jgi:hypothetical protein
MIHKSTSSPAAEQAVANATGAALQADSARALAALHRVPAEEFAGADHAFRAAMLDRFGPQACERVPFVPMEPVAREVLATYRAYWRAALARPDAREDEAANLAVALQRLLQCYGAADMDAIEPFVASLGWGDYAICGRRGAGGWATGDALYAVVPRYHSLDGEEFSGDQ